MRIHAYICMHVCTYIYMSLPVNIRAYIHVHVCAHVCVMMRICVCVSICEHAFVVCPCSPSCFACVCLTPPSSFLCILGLSDPLTNSPPNPPPLLRVLIFHLNNMVFILPFSYKLLGLVCMIFPKPLGDNTAVPFRRAGDVLYPHSFSSLARTHIIGV